MESLIRTLSRERIDILKIDIEGAETQLFSQDCDKWLSKVDNLLVELHDEEAEHVFLHALRHFSFDLGQCGELTVCRGIRRTS
jgi:hypothetical protein